eukprot:jgi/Chlat1/1452/Chrsp12S02065
MRLVSAATRLIVGTACRRTAASLLRRPHTQPGQRQASSVYTRAHLAAAAAAGSASDNATPSSDSSQVHALTVSEEHAGLRLDAFLAEQLLRASRAKVQASIKQGLVKVNGKVLGKAAHKVSAGDSIACELAPPPPMEASPEDIPLNIVYEDEHVIVVDKPAGMVVHPAAGNYTGTLVNALLHHCGLPAMRVTDGVALQGSSADTRQGQTAQGEDDFDEDGVDEDELDMSLSLIPTDYNKQTACIRPGIVHRLDKGTTGLLVVAKDNHSHAALAQQFKLRTVERIYLSVTCGQPPRSAGRIDAPLGRHQNDRKRMAVVNGMRGKAAASRFQVLEVLAGGGAALVQWRLETGRTHQIRVHAQHMKTPLLGDDTYGGAGSFAVDCLSKGKSSTIRSSMQQLVADLQRPSLHAHTLGFVHPWTGEKHHFTSPIPDDIQTVLGTLRDPNTFERSEQQSSLRT